MEKTYLIGDRTFTQKPLVLGQLIAIAELVGADAGQVMDAQWVIGLVSKSPVLLAVLLRDENGDVADHLFLSSFMDMPTLREVVSDFLSFNPDLLSWSSLFSLVRGTASPAALQNPSEGSSLRLQEEISSDADGLPITAPGRMPDELQST